jgi:hypothetical protein
MKIFLSYSHYDKKIAQAFYKHFSEHGFEVMWDGDISVGSKLDELQKMILGCDVFIVIISGSSMQSRYVQSEISLALGYMGAHNKPVIPYISVENNIPPNLLQYQCFMGTGDIESDASNLASQLDEIKGKILAQTEESQKAYTAAQTAAAEKVEVVKRNLSQYTKKVFERLQRNEKRDRRMAVLFYLLAMLFLGLAVVYSITKITQVAGDATVLQSLEYIISSVLTLAVVVALSRLAFTLGKGFMTNALRNEDRIHAISFGEFFIQAYGDEATRDEVRSVFSDWNIDIGTSFYSQNTSDFDPNVMSALEIIKNALSKKSDK